MRPAASLADYLSSPWGTYLAGDSFLHFFANETLCGLVLWGCSTQHDIQQLVQILEVELPERSRPHAAFVDARAVTSIDEAAFETLVAYVGPRAEAFGRNVTRQALVRPSGMLGAIVGGFYEVAPAANPEKTQVFDEPQKALGWLGYPGPGPLLAKLAELQAEVSGTPPLVRRVRDFLVAHPCQASVNEVARTLGMSPRTLQHQLRSLGTSFRREVNAARILAARKLLERTDTKLTAIAMEVGCSSLQHFSTLFRKLTGHTPSDWRARHRASS